MAKLEILIAPDPKLRQKAQIVANPSPQVLQLLENLKETLNHQKVQGLGLSAPQVGENWRIFVARRANDTLGVYLNPEITEKSKKLNTDMVAKEKLSLEGCLSIPNIYALIKRPWQVTIKYQTLGAENKLTNEQKTFEGFEASLIQHEIDHLNGILFTDHALSQNSPLFELDPKADQMTPVMVE